MEMVEIVDDYTFLRMLTLQRVTRESINLSKDNKRIAQLRKDYEEITKRINIHLNKNK